MKIELTYAKVTLACAAILGAAVWLSGTTQPTIKIRPMDQVGPRQVDEQTRKALVRDYLGAWQTLDSALQQNRAELLDESFVGVAKDKLEDTIRKQRISGIQTAYRPNIHDIRVKFYSPEGLSIQLEDDVEYEMEVRDHGRTVGTQLVRAKYIVVLTPTEAKWKVRVFQGGS